MVYSTRRFVVRLSMCHFVVVFSVLLVLRLPRLGQRELILLLFVRLFDLCLFGFVGFLFFLGSGKGCSLWLWHPWTFLLPFLRLSQVYRCQYAKDNWWCFLVWPGITENSVIFFSVIAEPLIDLLSKRMRLKWTSDYQNAFDKLKARLRSEPVLLAPNFNKEFKLAIDASDVGAGGVLLQKMTMVWISQSVTFPNS